MENSKPSSAGGKATAILSRAGALERYYKDPILCKNCNEVIHVKENEKVTNVKKRKFCNSSCSASFNNKGINRFETKRKQKETKQRFSILDLTKSELFTRYKNYQTARSIICKNARRIYFKSDRKKECLICSYNKKIHVSHIRAVSSFSDDSKISEINDIDNLTALCPNHHIEYDDGIIKL